jgi:nucleotide-binding universal stress UspA family protein
MVHPSIVVARSEATEEADMTGKQKIVVGVDGSDGSRAAVRYAIAEAARRGAEVVAVHAFEMPDTTWVEGFEVVMAPSPSEVTINIESRTRGMLHAMAEEIGGAARSVPVDAVAILGSPWRALLHQAREADLLVVGHRGRGAVASKMLGSVGLHVVLHAPCSVTVVPLAPAAEPVAETVAGAAPAQV